MSRLLLPLLTALLLAACATPMPTGGVLPARGDLREFAVSARFSLTHASERHAGRLLWEHRAGADELRLQSPFGQTVAEIRFDAAVARLRTADGEIHEAATPEGLLAGVLGYPLPVDDLAGWLLARPRGAAEVEYDVVGRPRHLAEAGWRISYDYDDEAADALPSRLTVTRDGGPELRLRIEEWRTP